MEFEVIFPEMCLKFKIIVFFFQPKLAKKKMDLESVDSINDWTKGSWADVEACVSKKMYSYISGFLVLTWN